MQGERIVVAQISLTLGFGGLERVLLDIARGLDRERFLPLAIALSEDVPRAEQFAAEDIPVLTVPQRGLDLGLPRRLAKVLREQRVDVVHAHNYGRFFYAGPAARRASVPVALYTEHSNTQPHERALWLTQRRISRMAGKVAAVSTVVREGLLRQGLRPDQVVVVPNGIDVEFYASGGSKEAARAELGLPADAFVIGTAGRFVPVKNHAMLLRAFARLRSEADHAWLAMAGDGELREETEALAAELGVADRVRFLGLRQDVPRVLAALDVFTLSSDSEGLPLGIIEAMAAGLPVAATKVGGMLDLVEEGATGLLSPVGDHEGLASSFLALARDPDLRRTWGDRAAAIAREKYSLASMANAYTTLYQDLLAARGRPIPGR